MRSMLVVATAISVALLACEVAAADFVATGFEQPTFQPNISVNGQGGWTAGAPGAANLPAGLDEKVVPSSVPGFGAQSLRFSNSISSGVFEVQPQSARNAPNAGEDLPNTEFVSAFQFTSTSVDPQDGLKVSISPNDGHDGRMSFVSLRDTPDGIEATIADSPLDRNGDFKFYTSPVLYSRNAVHTVRFLLKLVPGPGNDIVHVVIDGVDIGNQLGVCLTTWENYYRALERPVPVTDDLMFRSYNADDPDGQIPALLGHGYLFDNVRTDTTPAQGAVPACGEEPPPLVIDKATQTQSARPGDLVTYQIAVRNRSHAPERGVRVCDRPPRALSFVRSTARLRRDGGRLCLAVGRLGPGQRRTFGATFRLRPSVTAATVTNGLSVDIPAGSAPIRPAALPALPPPDALAAIPPALRHVIARTAAKIKVLRTVAPHFTG